MTAETHCFDATESDITLQGHIPVKIRWIEMVISREMAPIFTVDRAPAGRRGKHSVGGHLYTEEESSIDHIPSASFDILISSPKGKFRVSEAKVMAVGEESRRWNGCPRIDFVAKQIVILSRSRSR